MSVPKIHIKVWQEMIRLFSKANGCTPAEAEEVLINLSKDGRDKIKRKAIASLGKHNYEGIN